MHIRGSIRLLVVLAVVALVGLTGTVQQAQQGYTISGQITAGGRGVDGVAVAFFDGEGTQYAYTSGGGYYSHGVFPGWTGTITPSDPCYTFTPASAAAGPVSGNLVQDFTAVQHTIQLSGVVSDGPPVYAGATLINPLEGVLVTLTTGETTVTGGDGAYAFTVPCGWFGVITPLKVGWSFDPLIYTLPEPIYESMSDLNFEGTASSTTYTVSGRITDPTGRTALNGVTVEFFDGVSVHTEVTAGDGEYSYTLPQYWAGTVTPSLTGYSFSPAQSTAGPLTQDEIHNFTGTIMQVSLSGTIMTAKAEPIPGVHLNLSTGGSAVSGPDGGFSLQVPYGWSGNLVPSLSGWAFTPVRRTYSGVVTDQFDQHFVGREYSEQYTISGTVTGMGEPLAGVSLQGLPGTPVTDSGGFYSVLVNEGWSGTITPSLTGYSFSPAQSTAGPLTQDEIHNFTGTIMQVSLSGTIMTAKAEPIPGAHLHLSTGGSAVSGPDGGFSLQVPYGWSGNLVPSLRDWAFTPVRRTYSGVVTDQFDQHFIGRELPKQYTISGTVTGTGEPLAGVSLQGLPGTPVTDSGGFYSVLVNEGWSGTATPEKTGFTFTPTQRTYSDVMDDFVNQNFSADINPPPHVAIVRPPDGGFVSGSAGVEIEARDDSGVDRVELWINDTKVAEFMNLDVLAQDELQRQGEGFPHGVSPMERRDARGVRYRLVQRESGWTTLDRLGIEAETGTLLAARLRVLGWSVSPYGVVTVRTEHPDTGEHLRWRLRPPADSRAWGDPRITLQWPDGVASPASATVSCLYTWDTTRYTPGTYRLRARAHDNMGATADDEISVSISTLGLDLTVERAQEKAWIVSREYARLQVTVDNPAGIPVDHYLVSRRVNDGAFVYLREVAASEVQSNAFSLVDDTIESGNVYTYRVTAMDAAGVAVGASGDVTI